MPRAARICAKPGCPKPVAKRYCVEHDAEYEAKRLEMFTHSDQDR